MKNLSLILSKSKVTDTQHPAGRRIADLEEAPGSHGYTTFCGQVETQYGFVVVMTFQSTVSLQFIWNGIWHKRDYILPSDDLPSDAVDADILAELSLQFVLEIIGR